jgi:hypothetical protein
MIKKTPWHNRPEAKVIEKILSVFPETMPPDNKNIVAAEPAHLAVCDECRDAQQYFVGKTREDILYDERNHPHLVNAFSFFTPQTWHYYLPVFLIQGLLRAGIALTSFGITMSLWLVKDFGRHGSNC